jgi:hypothetical protein
MLPVLGVRMKIHGEGVMEVKEAVGDGVRPATGGWRETKALGDHWHGNGIVMNMGWRGAAANRQRPFWT